MKKIFIFLLLILFSPDLAYSSTLASNQNHQIQDLHKIRQFWSPTLPDEFDTIQLFLKEAEILYGVSVQKYNNIVVDEHDGDSFNNNNEVVLLKLTNGKQIKAIFKPRALLHQKAEVGAYEVAKTLGLKGLILPTVASKWKDKEGVLSYYIDVDDKVNFWKNGQTFEKDFATNDPTKIIDEQSLNDFYIFAQVFGMWDLKWRNILFVGEKPYHIMSIDNESLISPVYLPDNDYFYICWREDPECTLSPYQDLPLFENSRPQILTPENIHDHYEILERFFIKRDDVKDVVGEDNKKKKILENIEGCLWGQPSVQFYVGKKGLWMQLYHGYESPFKDIPNPIAKNISSDLRTALKLLNKDMLRKCYQDMNTQKPTFSDEFYNTILARRDQVLKNIPTIASD